MKNLILILVASGLVACGQTKQDETAESKPVPSVPESDSWTGTLCGDLLVWTEGMTFLVDASTLDVSVVPYGEYGHAESTNGWGIKKPACHYAVVEDLHPYLLLEQN